jgi:phosphomevalonate kinase
VSKVNKIRFIAPGKLILIGEYAVLEGSRGVVMAVDRYVSMAMCNRAAENKQGLVSFARRVGARFLAADVTNQGYQADSSEFFQHGTKLGLGSSAAVTVGAVASVFHEHGLDIENNAVRQDIWKAAHQAHCDFQGVTGSGIDLAASIFGDSIVLERDQATRTPIFSRVELPRRMKQIFFWTGRSASTPELLESVNSYKSRDALGYSQLTSEMSALTEQFIDACRTESQTLLTVVERYAELMERLGRLSHAPIVTEQMKTVFKTITEFGGAAKPSGAGGGDFIVAFLPADTNFSRLLQETKFVAIRLRPDRRGVHVIAA